MDFYRIFTGIYRKIMGFGFSPVKLLATIFTNFQECVNIFLRVSAIFTRIDLCLVRTPTDRSRSTMNGYQLSKRNLFPTDVVHLVVYCSSNLRRNRVEPSTIQGSKLE
jgi:hypothetical protein